VVQRDKGLWIHPARHWRQDVFVHISAVERAGLSSLNEGAKVSYEIVANRGKESAENLRVG
jgi:CspA family cold shock protein